MPKNKVVVIHEFGILSDIQEGSVNLGEEARLPHESFENLWKFILENKGSPDADDVLSVHSRRGRRYIKAGRYVGTVQTKDGQVIEILPKIYNSSDKTESDIATCRRVFLRMLYSFRHSEAKSFQDANLNTRENFPILEVYIDRYLAEVERLLISGIKKNYTTIEENQKYLKGKLLIHRQIQKNITDKTKFAVCYSKYIEDIPQNRIIVSTLNKLSKITQSTLNLNRCHSLLSAFVDIPESSNIQADLTKSMNANRLFAAYEELLQWSSQFLLNRGFTTFSGNHVNQSLLFSAEKLFESFIAHLFRKYAKDYAVSSQHSKYFLVDKFGNEEYGKFRLRPDIVVESESTNSFSEYDTIIIDTKWKNLDSSMPDKNYLIDIKDMYQLYAYGQKYHLGDSYLLDVVPKLVLIYPYTDKFYERLDPFIYEEIKDKYGLKLVVFPFRLEDDKKNGFGYKDQIDEIMRIAANPEGTSSSGKEGIQLFNNEKDIISDDYKINSDDRYMIVGYYKSQDHLNWIFNNKIYNVRLGKRAGALQGTELQITPSRIVLYTNDPAGEPVGVHAFTVNQSEVMVADKRKMIDLGYPTEPKDSYKLFSLGAEIKRFKTIDINKLRHDIRKSPDDYSPIFVKY